jgi:hypothetical protein
MANLALQPPLATDVRCQAYLQLIDRLQSLNLTPILVYRIPSLVDSAVIPMAYQWDVLNPLLLPGVFQLLTLLYPGWDPITDIDLLTNIDLLQYQAAAVNTTPLSQLFGQYRSLIQISTALHGTMGTVGALKSALTQLGYPSAIIQEGQNSWGGNQWPSDEGWAVFRILINLATVPADTDFAGLEGRIVAIANYWKPERCWLDSIQFQLYLVDTPIPPVHDFLGWIDLLIPAPSDFLHAQAWPEHDLKTIVPYYNARYYYGSDLTYGGTQPHVASGPVVANGRVIETT